MQLAVIEYARTVVGLDGAHTTEIDQKAVHKIVDIMESQKNNP
jgi:CTP synthase